MESVNGRALSGALYTWRVSDEAAYRSRAPSVCYQSFRLPGDLNPPAPWPPRQGLRGGLAGRRPTPPRPRARRKLLPRRTALCAVRTNTHSEPLRSVMEPFPAFQTIG